MTNTTATTAAPSGLFGRAVGMVFSPTETFPSVVSAPRSVGILFLVCLVMGLATGAPQLTEAGKRAALEMQVEQIERFTGQPVPPEQYGQMEQRASFGAYITMASMFVFIPFMTVLFAALYWAFFNIVLGGNAGFGQVLAVTAHSQVITALGTALGAPIQMMQGSLSQAGPFNLGALAPMLDPDSGMALFLGSTTFFGLWQAVVCGIGLGILYRRAPAGIIIGLLTIYLGVTALFTVGLSSVMGGH
jgi:hypothetical protein